MYPNRTMCEALEEMRQCYKSRNFAYLLGLIEEIQSMGNQMEAAIQDISDIESLKEERDRLHKEKNKLTQEIKHMGVKKESIKRYGEHNG